jgi:NAD(P)-dependent dehydrogenase (short-subunit alcohol dehydrogenase family)
MSGDVAIVAAGLDIGPRTHGIRVDAVAPQLLDTPANRAAFPAEVMTHAAAAPEAIAGVIAFLVSDAAAHVSRGRYCRRTALKQDPAYILRRPDRGQFPDGLRLPGERHADAAS